MRYLLSKVLPVRFVSTYRVIDRADDLGAGGGYLVVEEHHERSSWWQWRGLVFRHRRTIVA